VNKPLLKFVTDFGPLLIFFIVYSKSGKSLSTAIPPLIAATIIAVLISYIVEKKIPYIPLIGGIIISVFGGLTLYFNNPVFLYMKPTIINILFGFALAFERFLSKEHLLKRMLGKSISLSDEGWKLLTIRWMFFFFTLALLNEYVWRTQTEEFWVNFKVWGILPITFVFTAFQMFLINKHKI
jgi:intracellular septation protein|tara:strand:+ start:200 stop:745 length:546 start_codon:yes stop_codon:yes gene_type:complete